MTLHPAPPDVLAYERRLWESRVFVALNLGSAPRRVTPPAGTKASEVLVATGRRTTFDGTIDGDEGYVVALI